MPLTPERGGNEFGGARRYARGGLFFFCYGANRAN
jgi:hypothetical protein